jgi:hypothetical protein
MIRWRFQPTTLKHATAAAAASYSFLMYLSKIFEISRALFLGYRFCPPL